MTDILLVEDDVPIREVIAAILEDEGYEIATAANGQEALDYLQSTDTLPKLILLDLNMPVMTGWEFRKHQQQDPVLNGVPIVVVSAIASMDAQVHVWGEFITKPIDYNRLISIVQGYCQ